MFFFYYFLDVMLRYCDSQPNGSCCTSNIETKLALYARQQLERSTRDAINKLSSILSVRAQKFNGKLIHCL